jgi:hypothetical protein
VPADVPSDELDLGVACTNDWSRRQLAWLRAQVGDPAILEAVAQLPPGRKPWPLNVARQLGLRLPEHLAVDPSTPAAFFAAAKAMLSGKKRGSP